CSPRPTSPKEARAPASTGRFSLQRLSRHHNVIGRLAGSATRIRCCATLSVTGKRAVGPSANAFANPSNRHADRRHAIGHLAGGWSLVWWLHAVALGGARPQGVGG